MARPPRNNVDYFPYLCKVGKPMRIIEQKYGNDGYTVWIKILRELAITNFHHLTLSNHIEMVYLTSECRVTEELMMSIIGDLCALGEFDLEIWTKYKAVYSQKFIDSILDAYKKRENSCIDREGVIKILTVGIDQFKPLKNRGKVIAPKKKDEGSDASSGEPKKDQALLDHFIEQLESISNIEHVARTLTIAAETVRIKMDEFKKKAINVEYRNAMDLKNHFVNWLRKQVPKDETVVLKNNYGPKKDDN